jgi:hypothetical protein
MVYNALYPSVMKKEKVKKTQLQQLNLTDATVIGGMTETAAITLGLVCLEGNNNTLKLWLDPSRSQLVMVQSGSNFKQLLRLGQDNNAMMYL